MLSRGSAEATVKRKRQRGLQAETAREGAPDGDPRKRELLFTSGVPAKAGTQVL